MRALVVGLVVALTPAIAGAQTLMQRILAGGNGTVKMRYASRPNVCGGDRFVRMGESIYISGGSNFTFVTGRLSTHEPCSRGPAETRVEVYGGRIVNVKSAVASSAGSADRDLGVVSTAKVTKLFLDMLARPDTHDDERVFVALMLADSSKVWPELVRMARNPAVPEQRRGKGLMWAGFDGDVAAREPLAGFLRDASLSARIRQGAASGLAHLDDAAATRILTDFVRAPGDPDFRAKIVHIVHDRGDATATWREMAADARVDEAVRGAIFLVLSGTDDPKDGRLLRSLLPSLTTKKLRDRLMLAVSQRDEPESGAWLLSIGQSTTEDYETRKKALFWAGQSEASVKDVIAVYDRIEDPRLKEYMIFVIEQRKEPEATDKLIAIARSDPNREYRKKAMFWLAQRKDARAAAFLKEVLQ